MSPLQPNSPRRQAEPQFSRPIQLPDFDMSPASLLLPSALLTSSGASRRGALHRAVLGDEVVDGSPDPSSSWFNLRILHTPGTGLQQIKGSQNCLMHPATRSRTEEETCSPVATRFDFSQESFAALGSSHLLPSGGGDSA